MSQQSQLSLFDVVTSIQALLSQAENQWYDRKSVRISAQTLADSMIGFSNADGGRIVIGISKGEIEGIDGLEAHCHRLQPAACPSHC